MLFFIYLNILINMIKCIKVVKEKSIMGVFKKINKVLRITI